MPPDKVNALLNEYFGYIAQIVHIYQGHIDKYIGDCVMAVFGARNTMRCMPNMQWNVQYLFSNWSENSINGVRHKVWHN